MGNGITYDDRVERRDLMMPVDFARAALVFVDCSMPSDKRARCLVLQIPTAFEYPHCGNHFLKGIARERRKLVQRILELGLPFIIILLPNEEGFMPEKEVLNTAPLHEIVNVFTRTLLVHT